MSNENISGKIYIDMYTKKKNGRKDVCVTMPLSEFDDRIMQGIEIQYNYNWFERILKKWFNIDNKLKANLERFRDYYCFAVFYKIVAEIALHKEGTKKKKKKIKK
jgi:hypothetical protein